MDWSQFLPLGKLLLVFLLMLIGLKRVGLGITVAAGSLVLGLLFNISPLEWLRLALMTFTDQTILIVWGVIALVLALSTLMEQSGQAERFMTALSSKIHSPRARMVFFPVLIGLFPMPGGAVFSAPLINAVAKNMDTPNEEKSLINYWFRHVSEISWPLYPNVILAAAVTGITTISMCFYTLPMIAICFGVGWWFFARPLSDAALTASLGSMPVAGELAPGAGAIMREGMPLIVSLGGALALEGLLAVTLPRVPLDYGVLLALALGVGCCLVQNRLPLVALGRAVTKPHVRSLIVLVGALGIFKTVLVEGQIVPQLLAGNMGTAALWLTATILPFSVGLLVGMMLACVGAVLPLLVPLAQAVSPDLVIPWVVLALISAGAGNLASPLHICFVLSCEYFKVDKATSWKRLPLPTLAYWLLGFAYFGLLTVLV